MKSYGVILEESPEVFIKEPEYDNRGFILFKGSVKADGSSAFKNSIDEPTGLKEFLECNEVNSLFFCGIGREGSIQNSLMDSADMKFLEERVLVYDSTLPVGIDYLGDKDVFKKSIDKNKYVDKLREKNIRVINLSELMFFISSGKTIHDNPPLPKDQVGKALTSMENLFKN